MAAPPLGVAVPLIGSGKPRSIYELLVRNAALLPFVAVFVVLAYVIVAKYTRRLAPRQSHWRT
ncbi:MAG: hypothetical protein JRF15_13925 [Deltaproteobacteria bacterium]|nr:hypothetical protein [Deltaproteobacteria bacterium]